MCVQVLFSYIIHFLRVSYVLFLFSWEEYNELEVQNKGYFSPPQVKKWSNSSDLPSPLWT
jgi:hypothetical protein